MRRSKQRPRLVPVRRALIALVGALSLTLGGVGVARLADAATTPLIRVSQVGYPGGAQKIAYLLGGSANAGVSFSVLNSAGASVLTGTVGASRGGWNSTYTAVYPIDLSGLNTAGSYRISVAAAGTSAPFTIAGAGDLYAPVATAMTKFFQAQRDGSNVIGSVLGRQPAHAQDSTAQVYGPPSFQGDTDLINGSLTKIGGPVDVSGGWYDAGDYLKFTHTTAYALDMMLLAQRSGSADPARAAEIDHGLTWLDKMWDEQTGVLYAQVGIGSGNAAETFVGDHDVWRLPQDDDAVTDAAGTGEYYLKYRPAFRANAPGAQISPNLAGRVSAAFALAAQVHAQSDPARAATELDRAAKLYALAKTSGVGALVTTFPDSYYPETSWSDDMEFGAAELALAGRALGDSRAPTWLSQSAHWARTYLNGTDHDTLNLYDVSALAHPDLAAAITATSTSGLEVTVSVLAAGLKGQLDAAVTQAGQDRFRAGANYTEYDATSHELGLIAEAERYDDMVGAATYETFAEQQAGWVLGSNPWGVSMIIGVGTTFAKCPQHQVANLAGSRTGTGSVLVGAAVNGPNATSEFTDIGSIDSALPCPTDGTDVYNSFTGNGARFMDNVAAYQSVEPAIDFTSTGLLAFSLLGRGAASTPPPVVKQDTIGVFRPAGRTVYLRNSLSGGNADVPSFTVGDSGDVPVVGDWNHDGIDTVGTWRPSDQMVRLRNSNTPARPR